MTDSPLSPRLTVVIKYLQQHPESELDYRQLAGLAGLSPYYFHRQFSRQFGVSIGALQRLVRLQRAAWQLAYRPQLRILDIALEAGFSSGESFARTFRRYGRQTPLEFRADPDWAYWQSLAQPLKLLQSNQNSSDKPEQQMVFQSLSVALLVHQGPPAKLPDTIRTFIQWRRENGVSPPGSRTFNLLYDDPHTAGGAEWRFGLAASTARPVQENPYGVQSSRIPALRCLSGEVTGTDAALFAAVRRQHQTLDLPPDGAGFPAFIERIRWYPDVPESQALSRWYIPLAPA